METNRILLRTLKEDGIEELYCEPLKTAVSKSSVVSAPAPVKVSSETKQALLALREQVLPCTLCSELASTRKNVVFGAGSTTAKLMFVGEAPGSEEDIQGLPFVGRAGELLTKIIEAIQLTREQVFIANVLKCRPPQNRPPQPDEIHNCKPYLLKQIELIRPKIICALGTFASQTLLETEIPISKLRGKFYDKFSAKLICTYHPAYLLRNPADKRLVWDDMKMIRRELQSGH